MSSFYLEAPWRKAVTDAYERGRLHGQEALKDCLDKNEELANLTHAQEIELRGYRTDAQAMLAEALVGRFDELIAALRFYAEPDHYEPTRSGDMEPIIHDDGARARAILAKYATDDDEGGME